MSRSTASIFGDPRTARAAAPAALVDHSARRPQVRPRVLAPTGALARARAAVPGVLMVPVLVAAAAVRLWDIGAVGFNSDEAVYAGQGAALLGDDLATHFSVFRAHPLLLQLVMGLTFRLGGVDDTLARVVVALLFALTAVGLTYLLAKSVAGRTAGLLAAAIVACLPYHVLVSRQVLVDVPMATCMVAAVWLLSRHLATGSQRALIGSFALFGLAVLAKEIAVLAVLPVGFVLLRRRSRWVLRRRTTWIAAIVALVIVLPFPLTRLISQPKNASDFVLWQLTRAPNHSPDYFPRVLLQYGGPAFLLAMLVGVIVMIRRRTDGDVLALAWVGMFFAFFMAWPTKLFPYLYPIIPGMALMAACGVLAAARTLNRRLASWRGASERLVGAALAAALLLPMGGASIGAVTAGPTAQLPSWADFDIEVQSFAGGREMGAWALGTPEGARFLTIGPSIGNVMRFYGDRDSVALSVSNDPLLRNPAYVPVPNPDLAIRTMAVQYAVWDAYSADRSAFYNARLLRYVRRYDGVPVFTSYVDDEGELRTTDGAAPDGSDVRIVVYDLRGGPPGAPADQVVDP